VIQEGRARVGLGGLLREQRRHARPVEHVVLAERRADAGEARAMGHRLRDGDALLSVRGEPRPVVRHGPLERELPAIEQHCDAERREPLRAREDQLKRVLAPAFAGCAVGDAAPQVDDGAAVVGRRERRAQLAALGEIAREGVGDRLEAGGDEPLHVSVQHASHAES
jgi:hypothetical protein